MIKTIRYCDKCKKELPHLNSLQIVHNSLVYTDFKITIVPDVYYDLCNDCTEKLKKWINDND